VGELALPDFDVVNSDWKNTKNLWHGAEPLQFPRQLTLDFSRQRSGVIAGLVCEYPNTESTFGSLKKRLQNLLKREPKLQTPDFIVWRDEKAKRTVTLTLDESKRNVQLILVSIDKAVR